MIINLGAIYSQETSIEEIYKLKGKVKTVRYDSYLSKNTSEGFVYIEKGWEGAEKNDKLIEFNEFGRIIKISFYDKDSKLQRIHKYDYKDNKLIKSTEKYQKTRYSYDNKNRISIVKIFDKTPDFISATNIDETDKKEKLRINYSYDDKGILIKKHSENFKNGNISITIYFYNEIGFLEKEETVTDNYKEWYLFEYDIKGNISNKKWFDNDEGLLENEINKYSNSEIINSIWENYSEGKLEGKITYEYLNGDEVEINEFDTIDKTQITWKYTYEYDSHNNWIKKVAHTFKGEYFVVNRKIEYFK